MATILEPNVNSGPVPESSDRSFGIVFAAVFAIIASWPLLHLEAPRWWAFGVAGGFAGVAFIWPRILRPLNRAWLALGRLLHRVMSPLILGTIFFICVTPIAWILRICGKDVLSLALDPNRSSYWTVRQPAEPPTETMKRQF